MATATLSASHDYFASSPTRSSGVRASLQATPRRSRQPPRASGGAEVGPSTPSGTAVTPSKALVSPAKHTHRLLYRGALSLPDSHIILEGVTFVASPLDHTRDLSNGSVLLELLDNPLALALETMRGRPTIRLLGETRLDSLNNVWLDESGQVSLYIHPAATLTHTYFSNILLSMPFDRDPSAPESQRTTYGIRIALGDVPSISDSSTSSSAGTTEIIIFGRTPLSTIQTGSDTQGQPLRLVVARISTTPPVLRTPDIQRRMPRPDDPTPRRPPLLYFGTKRPREPSDSSSVFGDPAPAGKKAKPGATINGKNKGQAEQESEAQRRARDVMLGLHRSSSVSSVSSSRAGSVPASTTRASSSRKSSANESGSDPFKIPADPSKKGKERERANSITPSGMVASGPAKEASHYEEMNKLFVKRTVVLLLAKRGVMKNVHPEFADLYNHVYRGSSFALRLPMKSRLFDGLEDTHEVEQAVHAHMDLYLPLE